MKLFQQQLSNGNMIQFKNMSSFVPKAKTDLVFNYEKDVEMCKNLCENFSKRFQDLNGREKQMN